MDFTDFDWSTLDDSAVTLGDFAVPEVHEELEQPMSDDYDLTELFGLQPPAMKLAMPPASAQESEILGVFTLEQLQLTRDEFAPLKKQRFQRLSGAARKALPAVRRKMLGRKYANKQRAGKTASSKLLAAQCALLSAENQALRERVAQLELLLR